MLPFKQKNNNSIHRIIIVGSKGVGKTALVKNFIGHKNSTSSVHKDYNQQHELHSANSYSAKICLSCDTNADFQIVNVEIHIVDKVCDNDITAPDSVDENNQINRAEGCLCVFDLSQKDTFQDCTMFRNHILRKKESLINESYSFLAKFNSYFYFYRVGLSMFE